MAKKPSIPKGTRDFNPEEVAKRTYISETIQAQFQKFGFQPIETPSFENSDTLLGKYGDEGDRLIFKILNSGAYLNKVNDSDLQSKDESVLSAQISEKALRYDLTVPFARYVVQHQNEIDFPFKRYQIQPVWRADRPQKGRFREFYQCDADVVGSDSLWQEVEFIQLYDAVFTALKIDGVSININNRKILSGIAEVIQSKDKLIAFTVALDKLDKIGKEKVKDEMRDKGISEASITKLEPLFSMSGTFEAQIDRLKVLLQSSEVGLKGIEELEFINATTQALGLESVSLDLNVTLARGLNYYTGAIFEVAPPSTIDLGSIGGGGRYDDLTGIFGLSDVSGVGISFGLDRIYLVLEALNAFPETVSKAVQAIFINFGDKEALYAMQAIKKLRMAGVRSELYPDAVKLKKQMNYADKRHIPYVIIVGENEIKSQTYTIKNMKDGTQTAVNFSALLNAIVKQ